MRQRVPAVSSMACAWVGGIGAVEAVRFTECSVGISGINGAGERCTATAVSVRGTEGGCTGVRAVSVVRAGDSFAPTPRSALSQPLNVVALIPRCVQYAACVHDVSRHAEI